MRDTAGRFAKRTPKAASLRQDAAEPPADASPSRGPASRGTVPAPVGAPAGTYGMTIDEGGLGLHAPPGASVLAAPIMPTGAGLAVFYLKGAPGPAIYDLTHGFDPRHAQPVVATSTAIPLIDVVNPVTGQFGRIDADRIAALHRVVGIYTPVEILAEHRPAPEKLPVMTVCPEGMGEFEVCNASPYPMARPGETLIYDPAQREAADGALCVIEWKSGHRSVLLTNLRQSDENGELRWWADPVNRPSSRAMLERRLAQGMVGGLMFVSEGPFTEEHFRAVIVGRVVGVLVPGHREADEPFAQPVVMPEPKGEDGDEARGSGAVYAAAIRERETAMRDAFDDAGLTSAVSPEMRAAVEAHHEALIACIPNGEMEFDAAVALEQATDEALRTASVRSLADLRAKLTYLMPIIEPDMIDLTHVDHLRAMRDDLDRLCRLTPANDDGPDPILSTIAAHTLSREALDTAANAADTPWRVANGLDTSLDAVAEAKAALEAANVCEVEAWGAVFATRPTTAAGLVALIRHAQVWAPENDGLTGALDLTDIFGSIAADAERLVRIPPPLWPDLSEVPTAELAAMPFKPVERDSPCPVPSRDTWISDADTILPWLRMGWLYLSLDRDELADAMLEESDDAHQGMNESLRVAARNFDQLARFARAVLDRRMIGMAVAAQQVGAEG